MKRLLPFLVAGVVLGVPPVHRLLKIRNATQKTTEFCRSVRAGDDLDAVLERARSDTDAQGEPLPGGSLNVIFEERQGIPGWPRFVLWAGPRYGRVYCSLEPRGDNLVLAVHLGPLDADPPGFFEDWLSE